MKGGHHMKGEYRMIRIVGLILILLLASCSTTCVKDALDTATYFKEKGYNVRIAVGHSLFGYHAQAEVEVNGEWKYFTFDKEVKPLFFEPFMWFSIEAFREWVGAQ